MVYAFDCSKVLVSAVVLAACSSPNPLFHFDPDTETGSSSPSTSGGEATSATLTGETPTNTGSAADASNSGETGGDASTGGTPTSGGPATSQAETTDVGSGSSTGDVSDPSSSGGSDSGDAMCGDGLKDDGEGCDAGAGNGNGGECSSECQPNVCGDQYVGPGEACDDGGQNGNGSACTEACTFTSCGDGYKGGEEHCDDGALNGSNVDLCSHDCTQYIVQERELCVTPLSFFGKLFEDGVSGLAGADNLCAKFCDEDSKAVLGGEGRVASNTPYAGDGTGWVLNAYTAYFRDNGGPIVFVTGKSALLGVVGGADAPLLNPIELVPVRIWTGLNSDWTSSPNNCSGWNSKVPVGVVGEASATALGKYLDGWDEELCDSPASLYCAKP